MKRAFLFVCGVVVCSSCRPAEEPLAAAAVFAVEDLVPRAPPGFTPYLATEWQIPLTDVMEPLPAELLGILQQASGLPLAPAGLATSRDSSIVILYMFRPLVVRPDSVLVLAGWMGLVGGDGGGAWGEDYRYRLDCRRRCRLLAEPGGGSWN